MPSDQTSDQDISLNGVLDVTGNSATGFPVVGLATAQIHVFAAENLTMANKGGNTLLGEVFQHFSVNSHHVATLRRLTGEGVDGIPSSGPSSSICL